MSSTSCVERQTFVWGVRSELTVTAYVCILSSRNADLPLGTGKSVLLREIIKSLHKKLVRMPDAVAVTASTGIYTQLSIPWRLKHWDVLVGIAACNIGGVTIHSFAGIGLGVEDVDKLVEKIGTNRKASSRWRRTQVLIIDEG